MPAPLTMTVLALAPWKRITTAHSSDTICYQTAQGIKTPCCCGHFICPIFVKIEKDKRKMVEQIKKI